MKYTGVGLSLAMLLSSSGTFAAGIPEPHVVGLLPAGGVVPPNAVLWAELYGDASTPMDIPSLLVNGASATPELSPTTCTVGVSEATGGGYSCHLTFPLALPADGEVSVEVSGLTYTYQVRATPDEVPPALTGDVSGRALYYPAFRDGTSCDKRSPRHFTVELEVPLATDDVWLAGYVVYVPAQNANMPLYRVPASGTGDPQTLRFDLLHVEERTECYRVHAVDFAGNESAALSELCLSLSTENPEWVPDSCESSEPDPEPGVDAGDAAVGDAGPDAGGEGEDAGDDAGDDAGGDAGTEPPDDGASGGQCACVLVADDLPLTALLLGAVALLWPRRRRGRR